VALALFIEIDIYTKNRHGERTALAVRLSALSAALGNRRFSIERE
jgi:hypothetical protein